MKQYLLCLLLLAFASAASAQSTAFTYQGHLMDAGASANGNYDLQFTLKNALTAGATVGTPQAVSPVAAVNGIFTVTLDFGSAPFDGSDRWVELGVRPAGSVAAYTVLTPRQRLTATPYALRALNATNLTGTVAAANIATNAVTSVKINTGAVTTAKIAAGAVTDAQLASGIDAGKITLGTLADAQLSGNIPRLNATTNTFTGASGTIGLHTSLAPLSGTTLLGSFTSSTTNGAQLRFGRTGDFVDIGQNNAGAFVIETANDVPGFALTQSGNVGIGTSSPTSNLSIATTSGDATATAKLSLIANGGHEWVMQSVTGFGGQSPAGGFQLVDTATSITAMTVLGSGDVGIGNVSPVSKLNITDGHVVVNTTDAAGSLGYSILDSAGSERLALGMAGGIGAYSTDAAAGDAVLRASGGKLLLQSGVDGAAMTIATNNSVGIGTTNPATMLEVAGTITATAFAGDGAGLTNIPASAVATPPPGMVLIPAGAFMMGNSVAADTNITDAGPISTTVSAFYMDVNEVTLSQWQAVYYWAKDNGYTDLPAGSGKGPNHPVQTVIWYDVVKWCNARSEQAGKTPVYYTNNAQTMIYKTGNHNVTNAQAKWTANGYRLPTEAEWEKAARGGRTGQRFPWGNTITQNLANYNGATASFVYDLGPNGFNTIGEVGGESPATSPVGSFAANGYGLNDMAGNVWEWCWDWYGTPYAGGMDPKGVASGFARVIRGGGWIGYADFARCAVRFNYYPSDASNSFGFRAVLSPGQ